MELSKVEAYQHKLGSGSQNPRILRQPGHGLKFGDEADNVLVNKEKRCHKEF